ncbi:MAG: ABC transporter ATP-binding protein, partial [Acutalibacter sp.]|nr:ABC transporter ATP-binding protein [Acutalibacter sp.]
MRFQKEILRKNGKTVCFYLLLGIFCAFLTNFQAHYFRSVIDGLADRTITLGMILLYGAFLIALYLANYLGNYPEKKLEHGIYLDFKLLALKKISRIDYSAYQELGTGQLIQRIENGSEAGRNILFHFWFNLIREQVPNMLFSVFFIWQISTPITYAVLTGYVVVFIITNLLLKSLYKIKERILTNEEKLNHFLVRGFMEMLVFRMARQFPGEMRKAEKAKGKIVRAKTKMTMIHEAFFTIFALLVALLDVLILVYAWQTEEISIGSAVALLTLLNNAYTPIAIFNVIYVQYKLDRASFRRYEVFLSVKEDAGLKSGNILPKCEGCVSVKGLSFSYGERKLFEDLNLEIRPG